MIEVSSSLLGDLTLLSCRLLTGDKNGIPVLMRWAMAAPMDAGRGTLTLRLAARILDGDPPAEAVLRCAVPGSSGGGGGMPAAAAMGGGGGMKGGGGGMLLLVTEAEVGVGVGVGAAAPGTPAAADCTLMTQTLQHLCGSL